MQSLPAALGRRSPDEGRHQRGHQIAPGMHAPSLRLMRDAIREAIRSLRGCMRHRFGGGDAAHHLDVGCGAALRLMRRNTQANEAIICGTQPTILT